MERENLFEKWLNAISVSHVLDLITEIQKVRDIAWRPVGDRETNLATINLGSDPAAGVIERVTNALDSILERKWIELGKPNDIDNPRQAVEEWFGIESGRLANINPRSKEIKSIAEKVVLTLLDSGDRNRPTLDVRDFGTGIKSSEFKNTILSLNASRKLNKRFLAGAFGQGGSTALSYSEFTIIISKSMFEPQEVAATVVRFNQGDLRNDKYGLYEYLVDQVTGDPITFILPDNVFEVGTLVRHVAMDLKKYNSGATNLTGSLWYLTHHYLFDPVLPFTIEDRRESTSYHDKYGVVGRTIFGNNKRLVNGEHVEYQRSAIQTFKNGKVKISWWVLSNKGDNASTRIKLYTLPSKPIIITFNGQKQGELTNTIIKNDLKLPYLDKYLIVQVDCDNLDNESRRQLFTTTRESLRETSIMDELKQLVFECLAGDENLIEINNARKARYFKSASNHTIENIRKRLADRLKTYVKSSSGGKIPRVTPPDTKKIREPRPIIPVSYPPTLLEITNKNPRMVYAGKSFYLNFRTNADPSYFESDEYFTAIIDPNFGVFKGITTLKDGYGIAYFEVNESCQIGDQTEVTLELRPKNAKTLSSSINVIVRDLPKVDDYPQGDLAITTNINPIWVNEGDEYWIDNNWDENSVAKVEQQEDSIDVYVSGGNKHLNMLISRARRKDEQLVSVIRDMYLEHICFHALLIQAKEVPKDIFSITDEEHEPDKLFEEELARVCETICGMINQIYELLLVEVAATKE
ncbi:hypothetical protein HNQ85_001300 [Anoxybacillus calidus]|jgi:hypothetical protein|uniref:Uncharacterized protein n=1 Tax=[Anoxybacillus] calidus TaxID=575178 RepID=A0A7W0BV09_9BACL|nr:hypothetical protein [Anoxybacillus calidus]MBA2871030.1 hypothetical protein [Anoxybacillus calidus]